MNDTMIFVTLLWVGMPTIAAVAGIALLIFEGKILKRKQEEKSDE